MDRGVVLQMRCTFTLSRNGLVATVIVVVVAVLALLLLLLLLLLLRYF